MIGKIDPPALQKSTISAVCYDGLMITTHDGRPATLAILDADGNIVESGQDVAEAAWCVSIESHKRFLIGEGHLRVYAGPRVADHDKVAA